MNRRIIILVEQFLILMGLQIFFLNYFRSTVIPSFFLVWLLILAWEENTEIALFMAFITGMTYDLISKGFYGTTSIIFLVIVYINCFLKIKNTPERIIGIFIFSIVYFLMGLFKYPDGFLWSPKAIFKYSLLFALLNSIVGFFIEQGMKRLRLRWKTKKEFLSI